MKASETSAGIEVTRLANGLTVATDHMAHVETVSLGVWAGVGARHEEAAHNGVAHLLEHMVFKGTARRSAQDIAVAIEAVGGHLNAYTGREQTAYYAKVLAEDAPLAIDVIADILQNSLYDETELARERAVVLQEIGQAEDTPDDIIFDYFQETAFPAQAMGRPILGRAEVVRDLPRDAVAAYLQSRYCASRMVLSAAGRVDHEKLVGLAERAFDRLPQGTAIVAESAVYRGGELRLERDLEQVHVVLGFSGLSYDDPDYYAAAVLSQLLGGGMSSRLFQEVREKRGLVYSINSFASPFTDAGLFGIYAGTGAEEVKTLMPVICDELCKVLDGVSQTEVERSRAQLRAGTLMARERSGARAEQLASQLLIFGRPLPLVEIVARIEAVDRADVARVARRILTSPPTLAALGPIGHLMARAELIERLAR